MEEFSLSYNSDVLHRQKGSLYTQASVIQVLLIIKSQEGMYGLVSVLGLENGIIVSSNDSFCFSNNVCCVLQFIFRSDSEDSMDSVRRSGVFWCL